jgi:hypothetical protein
MVMDVSTNDEPLVWEIAKVSGRWFPLEDASSPTLQPACFSDEAGKQSRPMPAEAGFRLQGRSSFFPSRMSEPLKLPDEAIA